MGGRGEIRPTVTWEGEVKLTNCYMGGGGGRGTVQPTVTWEGEVSAANCYMGGRGKCDQLLHGRER